MHTTPPTYFHRPLAPISWSVPLWTRYNNKFPRPRTASGLEGVRYERAVVKYLMAELPGRAINNLPISFKTTQGPPSMAVPDVLVFPDNYIGMVIIEIKLRHSADAFYQLQFYKPIVSRAFGRNVVTMEICREYDPNVRLPVKTNIVKFLEGGLLPDCHNVAILTKRGLKGNGSRSIR